MVRRERGRRQGGKGGLDNDSEGGTEAQGKKDQGGKEDKVKKTLIPRTEDLSSGTNRVPPSRKRNL